MITAPINGFAPARDAAPPTGSNSSSNAITNAAGGAMGQDQFVQLLVTEMKNQDPMNPMDGKDLAAQLAQFSSVEQLMNVNTKLDGITSLLTPAASSVANSSSNSTSQGA